MIDAPKPGGPDSTGHIVVTGGAGFIGSHLVERLLADGHRVVVVDNLSTGRQSNVSAHAGHPRFRMLPIPVSQLPGHPEVMQEATFVFHLAAAVGVELVISSPVEAINTNLKETEAILEMAAGRGVPVLLASTSEVYGKSAKPEFSETDDLVIGPPHFHRWGYACSKLMDEFLALAYARTHQLPVTIARLFNTVGPRQVATYGMVLPRFIEAARANRPLRVYGDGTQTRCFCYVADTVEALVQLANRPGARGEVFNVGTSDEVTIHTLACAVIEVLGSDSGIELVPYDTAYAPGFEDMMRRKPCIEKLVRHTGFRPSTPLREIIRLTAAGASAPTA